MTAKLDGGIRQKRSEPNPEAEAFVNLQRTADLLMRGLAELLKPDGLSPTQYNVLRILGGAGAGGMACREVAERMITRDPDITRLLDRMEAHALVRRSREGKDRRVITVRIAPEGLRLLKELDGAVNELHRKQLGHLGNQKLRSLIELLEEARSLPDDFSRVRSRRPPHSSAAPRQD